MALSGWLQSVVNFARRHRFGLRVYERRALIDQLFAIRQTAASIAIDTGWACSAAITRPFLTTDVDRSAFFIALVVVDVLAGLANWSLQQLRRAVSRRSGAPRPDPAERRPDGGALGGIAFATGFGASIDRRTSVQAVAPSSGRVVRGLRPARLHEGLPCPTRHRSDPDGDRRGRLLPVHCARQTAFRPREPLHRQSRHRHSRARAGRSRGPSDRDRGGGRRGVRISRRVFRERRFRRGRADSFSPCAGEAEGSATRAHGHRPKPANGGPAIALAFTGLALFHTAMFIGSIPLAIVVTTSLGGVTSDIELMSSLCAALGIVVMGALIWRPLKRGERTAIVAGFAVFVAYFVVLALARSVGPVFWARIPARAIAIALVTYLGIGFLQSLLPHRARRSAALFLQRRPSRFGVRRPGAGVLAQAFGYASIFIACAILSAAGLVMICLV